MFKRKSSYSYSSYSYGSKRRIGNKALIIIIGIVLVLLLAIFFNLSRIRLLIKGYSWSETNAVLTLDKKGQDLVLGQDKFKEITSWVKYSNRVSLYDEYERYYSLSKSSVKVTIKYIDDIFYKQGTALKKLGYSDADIWKMIEQGAASADFENLVASGLTAKKTAPFRAVSTFQLKNVQTYLTDYSKYKNYAYTVNIVNYPTINTANYTSSSPTYIVTNPNNLLVLVKKGFTLSSDYQPSDLVDVTSLGIPVGKDNKHVQLRKATAKALLKMYDAAKQEGLYLALNSGYRSYSSQEEIYKEYEAKYGGQYAKEYVAEPGTSEHQTGLGADLTSQSVIDGKKLVFSDTKEYQWVIKNCYKYGFIIRFPENTQSMTGISHEAWHVRYVGTKVAKIITEKGWTFEEYCLYKSVIPKVKEK